jgi:integrase
LLAGRVRPTALEAPPVDATVRELCNRFLYAFRQGVESGKRSARTRTDYKAVCKCVVAVFGPGRLVDDLGPNDFKKLRSAFETGKHGGKRATGHGPHALSKDAACVRRLFRWGRKSRLIKRRVRFGDESEKPTARELREARNAKGLLMFEPEQVRSMLAEAKQPLRAMLLLGLNCGFGNHDCAMLPMSDLDLDKGWTDFPRPKTAIRRCVPLWPETVAALREAIAKRPKPISPEHAERVFITSKGNTWERRARETDRKAASCWTAQSAKKRQSESFARVLRVG